MTCWVGEGDEEGKRKSCEQLIKLKASPQRAHRRPGLGGRGDLPDAPRERARLANRMRARPLSLFLSLPLARFKSLGQNASTLAHSISTCSIIGHRPALGSAGATGGRWDCRTGGQRTTQAWLRARTRMTVGPSEGSAYDGSLSQCGSRTYSWARLSAHRLRIDGLRATKKSSRGHRCRCLSRSSAPLDMHSTHLGLLCHIASIQ